MSAGFVTSMGLAGLMGFRHGFDADHIAVVDGMTRSRQLHHNYWTARLVGLQFAAGHSAAILVVALLLIGQSAALPSWLDGLGVVISVVLLLVIAGSNLAHALVPPRDGVRPLGPVATLLFSVTGRELHPALVGVAFAMSLDSMTQAALFASHGGGVSPGSSVAAVALLASTFGVGMMLADAGNGLLLAWFAQRSDELARRASRFSSAFIAMVALTTAVAAVMRETRTGFAQAWEQADLWTGVGLLLFTSLVYAMRLLLLQRANRAAKRL